MHHCHAVLGIAPNLKLLFDDSTRRLKANRKQGEGNTKFNLFYLKNSIWDFTKIKLRYEWCIFIAITRKHMPAHITFMQTGKVHNTITQKQTNKKSLKQPNLALFPKNENDTSAEAFMVLNLGTAAK